MVFSLDRTPRAPDAPDAASDAAPLRRVRTVARLMDDAVRVPGTDVRVGLDPLFSVVPWVGSWVGAAVSLYIVLEAAVAGVPLPTLVRMLATVAVDAAVGTVPVVGVVFDAVWKSNVWNVRALEAHLADGGSGA